MKRQTKRTGAGVQFDLKRPCKDCPFRRDVPGYLRPGRMEEILASLDRGTFPCHKTTGADGRPEFAEHSVCAGSLVFLQKSGTDSFIVRLAQGLKLYDPSGMDLESPVFDNAGDLCRHHSDSHPPGETK